MTARRIFAALSLTATAAFAQNTGGPRVDPLRTGVIEFGLSGGLAAGDVGGANIDLPGVITYRVEGRGGPSGKLHVGLGMWSRYQFVADAAVLGGGRAKSDLGGGFQVETKTNAIVYGAGIHVRFPVSRRLIPYLALGGASVQSRSDTLVLFTAPTKTPGLPSDAATRVRLREGSFAGVAGGGAQFFPARSRVGLRVEVKSYFPTGTSHTPFMQLTAGVLTWVR
ncbi:MAG: hypothetical protein NTW28_17455 [Candidatus Solibacter sp.]|nr:hypothetical protein [Candidatus Solibacter sp.]